MNKWKELKIDNLPSDILTGDYEFEYLSVGSKWRKDLDYERDGDVLNILNNIKKNLFRYRYRKPEPLPATHEGRVTKWWLKGTLIDAEWEKVSTVSNSATTTEYYIHGDWRTAEYFNNRKSADIPPEASE